MSLSSRLEGVNKLSKDVLAKHSAAAPAVPQRKSHPNAVLFVSILSLEVVLNPLLPSFYLRMKRLTSKTQL